MRGDGDHHLRVMRSTGDPIIRVPNSIFKHLIRDLFFNREMRSADEMSPHVRVMRNDEEMSPHVRVMRSAEEMIPHMRVMRSKEESSPHVRVLRSDGELNPSYQERYT